MLGFLPGTWLCHLISFILSLESLIFAWTRITLILSFDYEIMYGHNFKQLIEGYYSVIVQKQNGQAFFVLKVRNHRVQSSSLYLFKLKLCFLLEVFQRYFDDCYSFSDVYGRCWYAYLGLKWSGLFWPSPVTVTWSENRIWRFCVYSDGMMIWITSIWCIEGVWSESLEDAQVDWEFVSYGSICAYMKFENDFWVWLVFMLSWGF